MTTDDGKTLFSRAIWIGMVAIANADLDTAKIDKITGLKGKFNQEEGVYKVTFPRSDVPVSVAGWSMPPFMGLGTWAAFQGSDAKAMMMGDTVLFEDEVNSAMSAALDNGLSVTALHNHFFFDKPKVYFMHIGGEGSAEKLATAVKKSLRHRQGDPRARSQTGRHLRAENAREGSAPGQELHQRGAAE